MARFMIFSGIISIIAAVIFLLALLGAFGNDISEQIIVPIACENETDTIRTQHTTTYSGGGVSENTNFFCVDAEGIEEDVTGTVVVAILVGFVGLLILGLILTIGGSIVAVNRVQQHLTNQVFSGQGFKGVQSLQSSVIDLRDGSYKVKSGQMPQEAQAILQQVFSQMGSVAGSGDSLADRLRQLEEARQEGLITGAEYERLRQAILDSMDD